MNVLNVKTSWLRLRFWSGLLVCAVALGGCELLAGMNSDATLEEDISEGVLQSARTAEAEGRHAVAAAQYRKLEGKSLGEGRDVEVTLGLARNLRYIGEAGQAIQLLAASEGLKTEQPAFLLEAAKAEIAAGTPSRALEYLSKARFLDDGNWDVHNTTGIAYDMVDAYDKAAEAYARAQERAPANPAVLNNMAISAALAGNLDHGIEILEAASLTVRRDARVRQNLALLYGLRGDEDKARAISRLTLEEEDIRNNLSVYSRLRSGAQHKSE